MEVVGKGLGTRSTTLTRVSSLVRGSLRTSPTVTTSDDTARQRKAWVRETRRRGRPGSGLGTLDPCRRANDKGLLVRRETSPSVRTQSETRTRTLGGSPYRDWLYKRRSDNGSGVRSLGVEVEVTVAVPLDLRMPRLFRGPKGRSRPVGDGFFRGPSTVGDHRLGSITVTGRGHSLPDRGFRLPSPTLPRPKPHLEGDRGSVHGTRGVRLLRLRSRSRA